MEKEKREPESCTSCAYRKGWYCPVAGDRVKREGHCSEYEKSKIAKEKQQCYNGKEREGVSLPFLKGQKGKINLLII